MARGPSGAAVTALLAVAVIAGCSSAPKPVVKSVAAKGVSPGCGARPVVPAGPDRQLGTHLARSLTNGATVRTAVLHVPAGYRSTAPTPVVLEFHGAGPDASAAAYQRRSPLAALSDRDGFIDVAPQGLRYPLSGNLGWNAFGPVQVKIAEIPFVNAVLDLVEREYCVDVRRIYASGISNGADMVNYLACRDASRIAAIAPVVGPMYGQDDEPCRPFRPVPIIDLHSVDDPAVPYAGRPSPPADYSLPSVDAWLAGWAALDGCAPGPGRVASGAQVRRTWTKCRGGAAITAYAVHAGHAWPATLDGRPAGQVVWDFLRAHTLPG